MDTADKEIPERDPDRVNLPDHYAALKVQASASQQEIGRAYRALMRNLHPDVDHPDADAGRPADSVAREAAGERGAAQKNELLRIMQAFAVLRDPRRRAAYDQSVAELQAVSRPGRGPQSVPVRYIRRHESRPRPTIGITPVRWESGPWA